MQISLTKLVLYTAFGLLCTLALTVFLQRAFGDSASMISILTYPLHALVSWPLIQRSVAALLYGIRSAALKDVHGSFYSYQGIPIKVVEDDDHCRWVPIVAVRKIVGTRVLDETFVSRYPNGWRKIGSQGHIREDALHHFLSDASALEAVKFKNWVLRSLVNPAKKIRSQKGIVVAPPAAN